MSAQLGNNHLPHTFGAEAQTLLAAIVESSQDAIVSKNLDGIVQSWNAGAEQIFGWPAREIVGKPITVIIPEDRLNEERTILEQIRSGKRVEHFETVRVRKDGRNVFVSVAISPIRDRDGSILGASKVARDVTQLRDYERRLTDFVETATVGLHWVGPDGIILWANRCELDLLGYTREEYIGRHIAEFHADQPVIEDILDRLSRGETLINYAARLRCKDGSIRHVLISSCVRFEGGKFLNTQCFTRDVTELKRAQEERDQLYEREREARKQAEEAGRMKDDFLATLSHELRTPLNAVLGYAQLLRTGSFDAVALSEAAEIIERNARAQAQIIEDLLDLSRIVTGKIRMDVQRVDLSSVVTAAIDTVGPAAMAKGVTIVPLLDSNVGPIRGDPSRLQQVVWNLLSNAVKFTPRGGQVQVALERVDSHVEIVVSDTGDGITPEFLPHVFARFRQADSGITRRHGGLGIGLAIVKQLVELHGGSVRAKSPGPGCGSTFSIALPLSLNREDTTDNHRTHPKAASVSSAGRDEVDLAGLRVLVIDDEPDARSLLAQLLGSCHAHVVTAGTVDDALHLFSEKTPDVVISDLGLPERDGYDLIQTIRSLPAEEGGSVPAVALSAFARSEDRRRAMLAGFQSHIAKPFESSELVVVVASLAGRVRRTQA